MCVAACRCAAPALVPAGPVPVRTLCLCSSACSSWWCVWYQRIQIQLNAVLNARKPEKSSEAKVANPAKTLYTLRLWTADPPVFGEHFSGDAG